ncbi:MAG: holo-ACP synthase [Planctomycetota bacterium]|jgi:holo-[acyl-carrier protein] synthase|nr:holo-ACP synthase [Planctomycetota bacterium]
MIIAVGTDLVELDRVSRIVSRHGKRFLARILTDHELAYCKGRGSSVASIGARFAAKEAVMKLLGTGWGDGVGWRDIEVRNDAAGNPSIEVSGEAARLVANRGIRTLHVSLSHTNQNALAMVVAES